MLHFLHYRKPFWRKFDQISHIIFKAFKSHHDLQEALKAIIVMTIDSGIRLCLSSLIISTNTWLGLYFGILHVAILKNENNLKILNQFPASFPGMLKKSFWFYLFWRFCFINFRFFILFAVRCCFAFNGWRMGSIPVNVFTNLTIEKINI